LNSWYSRAVIDLTGRPRTITWAAWSVEGLSRTGFMSTVGSIAQARAWTAVERPISPPSRQTWALFAMFCALNGATRRPSCRKMRQSAATRVDLPTPLAVPWIMRAGIPEKYPLVGGCQSLSNFQNLASDPYLLRHGKEAAMKTLNLIGVALMSAFGGYIAGVPLDMFLVDDRR
jgi:hypothetical protein